MRPKEMHRRNKLADRIQQFESSHFALPGISLPDQRETFFLQLIDSRRRIEFVHCIRDGQLHPERMNPSSELFDPLRAAVLQNRIGNNDEAAWLVFLAVHFGKHHKDGWLLCKEIYGRLGGPHRWDWPSISGNLPEFHEWYLKNYSALKNRRFSNHRKYESLNPNSKNNAAIVIESYVNWVDPPSTLQEKIRSIHKKFGQSPRTTFDALYRSMDVVRRFGRLGRFDYLTMLGKLGVAPIEPGSAYLSHNATGPLLGARLLFGGAVTSNLTPTWLDANLCALDEYLMVGMQALEDALCNWQKSPNKYISFSG